MSSIPVLPVERHTARVELEEGLYHRLYVNRGTAANADRGNPDSIQILSSHFHPEMSTDVSILIHPAMLVHMANELLTDNERAQIRGVR